MSSDHEFLFWRFVSEEGNLTRMVCNRVEKYGEKTALRDRVSGSWREFSWSALGEMIEAASSALLEMGIKEKERVGIFSQNRAEWTVADLAVLGLRAVTVPVYATNSRKETEYIVKDACVRIMFVSDQTQYNTALSIQKRGGHIEKIIVFDERVVLHDPKSLYFSEFLNMGRESGRSDEVKKRLSESGKDDLATIIYTAGTTGCPRGVMLTRNNFLFMTWSCSRLIRNTEKDVALSFLPLSHIFERSMQFVALCGGTEYVYCHNPRLVPDFLREVKPHLMCTVPGFWERIYAAALEKVKEGPAFKESLFEWACNSGQEFYRKKFRGEPRSLWLRLRHLAAYHLVIRSVQALTGGRCRLFLNGGAPFNYDINRFFISMGIPVFTGYGLTEMFPVSMPDVENFEYGTSGSLLPLVEFRLSDDGEIIVRGPNLMKGYYGKPEETRDVMTEEGWLKTGDVGHLDEEGRVVITDRIKELIITSGGKNISPAAIESLLKMNFFIEQAVVIGEGRAFLSALIVPSFSALEEFASKNSIEWSDRRELISHREIIRLYGDIVEKQCENLGRMENIRHFTLLAEELTQEKGELTPTSKLKRKVIYERYGDVIEKMYSRN